MINQKVSLIKSKNLFKLLTLAIFLLSSKSAYGMWNFNHQTAEDAQRIARAFENIRRGGGNIDQVLQRMLDIERAKADQIRAQNAPQEAAQRHRFAAEDEEARRRWKEKEVELAERQLAIDKRRKEQDEEIKLRYKKQNEEAQLAFEKRKLDQQFENTKKLKEMDQKNMEQLLDRLCNPDFQKGQTDRTKIHSEAAIEKQKLESQQAIEQSKIKWDGINGILNQTKEGLANTISSPKRMSIIAATTTLTICAYHGIPFAFKYLRAKLMQPSIVAETSVQSFFGSTGTTQEISLDDVIMDSATSSQLTNIAQRIKNAKENEENLFNILLYGPPGTGKTMYAKALAYTSGLDYAIMSGSEFTKIKDTNVAIAELQKLIRWAEQCENGLIIFVDESESFLANRELPNTTTWKQDMLNAFLAAVPKPTSKKIAWIFATNHPYKLDDAVINRIGERVKFDLPGHPEREKLLKMYINKSAKEKSVKVNLNEAKIAKLAQQLENVAPREIEFMADKMTSIANQNKFEKDSILTHHIAHKVVDTMKESIQETHKWEAERKRWVEQQTAAVA